MAIHRSMVRSPQDLEYLLREEFTRGSLHLPVESFAGTLEKEVYVRILDGRFLRMVHPTSLEFADHKKCSIDYFVDFIEAHHNGAILMRRLELPSVEHICVIGTDRFDRKGGLFHPIAWFDRKEPHQRPILSKISDFSQIGPDVLCVLLYINGGKNA